jgi:putative Mn2+ efflux pump MntP
MDLWGFGFGSGLRMDALIVGLAAAFLGVDIFHHFQASKHGSVCQF